MEIRELPTLKVRRNKGGARWVADWYERDGAGKRAHRSLSIGPVETLSRKAAKKKLAEELSRLKAQSGWTLRRFITEVWLPSRLARWSRNTVASVPYMIDSYIIPTFGERQLETIRKMDVEAWMLDLAKRGLSRATGRVLLATLGSIMREAIDNELIERDPTRRVTIPEAMRQRAQTKPYSEAELADALRCVYGQENIMLRILCTCGLRPGEMLALRVGDLNGRILTVDESTDGGGRTKSTKTKRVRNVPVPPMLLSDLKAWIAALPSNPNTPLFVQHHTCRKGRIWTVCGFRAHMRKILGDAIPGFNLRRFRATFATRINAELADVRDMLGHTTTDMTLEHYRSGIPERQYAAVEAFEGDLLKNSTNEVVTN